LSRLNDRQKHDTGMSACSGSSLLDYTVSVAGREWIQVDSGQAFRLPANGKESTIESIPNAGIS
jgi:hypothetical protein